MSSIQACQTEQSAVYRSQAVRLLIRAERGIPIPYYLLQHWAPLQSPAEFLTLLAFRQAAWINQARGPSVSVDLHLSDLSRWCGLSPQRLDQVTAQARYLDWFVRKETPRTNRKARDRWQVLRDLPLAPQHLLAISHYVEKSLPEWLAEGGDLPGFLDDLQERIYWVVAAARPADAAAWTRGPLSLQKIVEETAGRPLSQALAQVCAAIQRSLLHVPRPGSERGGRAGNSLWVTHYFLEQCLPRLGSQMGVAVLRLRYLSETGQIHGPLYFSDARSGYQTLSELMAVDFRTARKWVRGLLAPPDENEDPRLGALAAFLSSLPAGRDVLGLAIQTADPIWAADYALLDEAAGLLEQGKAEDEVAEWITRRRVDLSASIHESLCPPGTPPFMSSALFEAPAPEANISFHENSDQAFPFMKEDIPFDEQNLGFHEPRSKPLMTADKTFGDRAGFNKESFNPDSMNLDSFELESNQQTLPDSGATAGSVGWFPGEIRRLLSIQRVKPRGEKYQAAVTRLEQDETGRVRFIGWLLWAYQRYKGPTDRSGIVSPELYALNQLSDPPPRAYLELAELSPGDLLDRLESPLHREDGSKRGLLDALSQTPLMELLNEIVPGDEDPPPEGGEPPGAGQDPVGPPPDLMRIGIQTSQTDPPARPPGAGREQALILWDALREFIGERIQGIPDDYINEVLVLKALDEAAGRRLLGQIEAHRAQIERTGLLLGVIVIPMRPGDFAPLSLSFVAG